MHSKILRDYNLQLESWLMFFKKNLTNRFGQDWEGLRLSRNDKISGNFDNSINRIFIWIEKKIEKN